MNYQIWGTKVWQQGALLLVLAALFFACDKEKEPIPAYLTIEPFELVSTDIGKHGSISHKITHADIFLFDSLENRSIQLGVFELPATIPVVNTGSFSLNVDPIIKANGSVLYLQVYPFYKRFSTKIELAPNTDLSVTPTTTYIDEAVFEFVEDFEGSNLLFEVDRDDNPQTVVERTASNVFEGQYSASVKLDTTNNFIIAQTEGLLDLTVGTAGKIYLEMNYRTDVPLEFGIIPVEANGMEGEPNFEFAVLAKEEWNKIYFDLTEIISKTGGLRFALIFRGGIPLDEENNYSLNEAEILLDNVKLVHF